MRRPHPRGSEPLIGRMLIGPVMNRAARAGAVALASVSFATAAFAQEAGDGAEGGLVVGRGQHRPCAGRRR